MVGARAAQSGERFEANWSFVRREIEFGESKTNFFKCKGPGKVLVTSGLALREEISIKALLLHAIPYTLTFDESRSHI